MSTTIRPTLVSASGCTLSVKEAYRRVRESVRNHTEGIIAGKLHDPDTMMHCAIGCYFTDYSRPLPTIVVEDIATYNDSIKTKSAKVRRKKVLAYLKAVLERFEPYGV